MKRSILAFFILTSFSVCAQKTINNYKYVIVPAKFDFQKDTNQYSLNGLTSALLENKGFTVYPDNNLPPEIANNKCLALMANVTAKNSMFTTGLTLTLKDCQGVVVFKSKDGKSREKEYETAYNMALRDAFSSLDQVPYNYTETVSAPAQSVAAVTPPPAAPAKVVETPPAPVPAKATEPAAVQPAGTLYAQAIPNGYQLADTTPKIVLTILKTSVENYFIASNGTANGIVLKKDNDWFFEHYKDGKLVSEKLTVKF